MGLVLSVVISYAGLHEAVECVRHLVSGVVPYEHPGFDDLVDYYTSELHKSTKQANDWTTACGQGYLCLNESDGKVSGAAVKYYHAQPDSTAILFCTKISSFGDSVEEPPVANGDYRKERYSPAKTKTLVLNTTPETITVANRKSPGPDPRPTDAPNSTQAASSTERRETVTPDAEDKLTWQYTPLNSTPEIHFQSYDDDKPGFFTEDYLRSRSRERRNDTHSVEEPVDSAADDAKLIQTDSVDEAKDKEVIEEEDDLDFWGNSSD